MQGEDRIGGDAGAPALRAIFGLLAAALTIAGLALGRDLIVPLVLAVLLAFVLAPVVVALGRLHVPQVLGVVMAVLLAAAGILGLGMVMARQAGSLMADWPTYQQNLQTKLHALRLAELMQEADAALRNLRQMVGDGVAGRVAPATGSTLPPPATMAPAGGGTTPLEVIQGIAGPVLEPIATAGIVVLFAIIVLIYREDLRDRVIRLAGSRDLLRTTLALNDAARRLSRLFLAQVVLNAALGAVIGGILWVVGLPGAALWGILAGLMRFVPFFGTFIALVPPLLLAVAVDPGWSLAIWVLATFLVAEPMMGQVLEPAVYGHSTGLSPVAVLVAATFWTFLWGPIGLLLATPLTVCLVVLGRHVRPLAFLDIVLGDRPPLQPEESFYQRALQGDGRWLADQSRRVLKADPSLVAYHDGVALPALVLADQDWSREVLEPERLEAVRVEAQAVIDRLRPTATQMGADMVVCTPGRGQLDDLAAAMAMQVIQAEGIPAVMLKEAEEPEPQVAALAGICCLSAMEEGNTADGLRFLIRRWQRRLPEATIVIGLWHANPDSPTLQALRGDEVSEIIVTSLGELVALCRTKDRG